MYFRIMTHTPGWTHLVLSTMTLSGDGVCQVVAPLWSRGTSFSTTQRVSPVWLVWRCSPECVTGLAGSWCLEMFSRMCYWPSWELVLLFCGCFTDRFSRTALYWPGGDPVPIFGGGFTERFSRTASSKFGELEKMVISPVISFRRSS